ncbi:MAG: AmmeMemoRadiSam system protein B [Planctomycetes bacterium]|nr:AmmeMemoRadiSam system protein B [Planctomycetota bacterium]
MADENPRLRSDIQVTRGQAQGKQVMIIQDPTGIIPEPIALSTEFAAVLAMLDGTRSIRDIQYEMMRMQGGVLVASDTIQDMVDQLDQALLLDSDRYRQAVEDLAEAYAAEPIRQPIHIGQAYPEDPGELREYLDNILAQAEPKESIQADAVVALVAPHIDIQVGERVYANAYGVLKGAEFDRVIILGIMHRSDDGLFSLSRKSYKTPLGVTETDLELAMQLSNAGEGVLSENDLAHRTEHSIEFQVVFLQHVLARSDIKIVPILCGGMSHMLTGFDRPSGMPDLASFLDALREAIEDQGRRTLLVAGVDLSHIGPKFGDRMSSHAIVDESEKHDRALLDVLCKLDAEAFWAESCRVEDRYNVCGFPALACMTEVLSGVEGHLLDYEIWHEEPTRSAVSFAAAAFTTT